MIFLTKSKKSILFRRLDRNDYVNLSYYLANLSEASKQRFGPHPFDLPSINDFYNGNPSAYGYIGLDLTNTYIVAYGIMKYGYWQSDKLRYDGYNILLVEDNTCTYAPSVADYYHGDGIGDALFQYMVSNPNMSRINQIVLWGGVQATNLKAVAYYEKNNFIKVGEFVTTVNNFDMILYLK